MLNIIRYSQIVGLVAVDGATAEYLGEIQDVWVNDAGQIVYLSCPRGYIPLLQVAGVSTQAVSTYGHLAVTPPSGLHRLHQLPVQSPLQQSRGRIEDFLFDWHTGEIAAYILTGDIAAPASKPTLQRFATSEVPTTHHRVVLAPDDVKTITVDAIVLESDVTDRFRSEAEGLKDFLSEKRHPVRQLVHELSDRLHDLVSPHDPPEVVRVKIKTVGDEMAAYHDHQALKEAIDFLHTQWESLQQQIRRASNRAQHALESAWEHLTGKPS
ncbi:photosystem reaction center subunit h [Leptolyngbya sp. Heron Island J]|uniref:PRC-barrel domain-containing protein n=1 Tax=Leptolyngbya sp. Heron Island J TaxID=1385935 RepID=UPI0003B98864|nr:PRC-barrel domain-containing protein [Leptolyngbya sp. Heron Island J]ESA36651.1 photosystem reaction center subunit h [Leptolyngbya sp. Heron Island J]